MVVKKNPEDDGYKFFVLAIGPNKWGRGFSVSEAMKAGFIRKSESHMIYAGWAKTCYAEEIHGVATWEGLEYGGMKLIERTDKK